MRCEQEGCERTATHTSGMFDRSVPKMELCPDHTNARVGDCSDGWWFRLSDAWLVTVARLVTR